MRLASIIAAGLGLVLSLGSVTARADDVAFNTSGLRVFASDNYVAEYGLPQTIAYNNKIIAVNPDHGIAKVFVAFLKEPADQIGDGFARAQAVQQHWQFQGLAPNNHLLITLARGGSHGMSVADNPNNLTVGVAVGQDLTDYAQDLAHDTDINSLVANNKIRLGFKDDVAAGDVSELIVALSGDLARVLNDREKHNDADIKTLVSLRAAQAATAVEPVPQAKPVAPVANHAAFYRLVVRFISFVLIACGVFALVLLPRGRRQG